MPREQIPRAPREQNTGRGAKSPDTEYLEKLYKGAWFINFENLPFKGGSENPLIPRLGMIQSLGLRSQTGKRLEAIYNDIKASVENENPIIKRVFMGELLRRLNPESEGFADFMQMMTRETRDLQMPLRDEVNKMLESMRNLPEGPQKERMRRQLMQMIGGEEEPQPLCRPLDSVFEFERESGQGGEVGPYGPLETVEPVHAGREIMDISRLDPFQIILYKQLISGYNEFAAMMTQGKDIQKLYNLKGGDPKIIRLRYRQIPAAIDELGSWIMETVNKMEAKQGANIDRIFNNQINLLRFPSLPETIPIISGIYSRGMRFVVEGKVKNKLKAAVPVLQMVAGYLPLISPQLERRQMFRAGQNRSFLNRFWSLAYRQYQNSRGEKRLQYEFVTMVIDSIRDDNELLAIIDRIKHLLIDLLKNTPEGENISQRYFNKPFSQLDNTEIDDMLKLLLPSRTLSKEETESREYSEMKLFLNGIGAAMSTERIKQNNYALYTAITTVSHNMLNLYTSLARETNTTRAKEKIQEFINGFEAIKKLLGEEGINKIAEKSPHLADVFRNPQRMIAVLRGNFFTPASVKRALSDFERINNLRQQPQVVLTVLNRAKQVEQSLLRQRRALILKQTNAMSRRIIDYSVISDLERNKNDIKQVREAVNELVTIWDENAFAEKEREIIKKIYGTRCMQIPEQSLRDISFLSEQKAEQQQEDYNNFLYISNPLQRHITGIIRRIYSRGNQMSMFRMIEGPLRNIISTLCNQQQEQLKNENLTVYAFLNNIQKRQSFASEIADRINRFLSSFSYIDQNNEEWKAYNITGDFAGNIQRYIIAQILPKARIASEAAV